MMIGGQGVTPVSPEDVERALLALEEVDREAANLLRNYIRGLESRLETYRLGDDDYPGPNAAYLERYGLTGAYSHHLSDDAAHDSGASGSVWGREG